MIQRHYHRYVLLLSLLLVASGALMVVVWLYTDSISYLLCSLLFCLILLYLTAQAASFVPNQVKSFLASLLNKDMMSCYPLSNDKELQQMYRDMNHIMQVYNRNMTDLETKRLYYDRILRIMTHELRNSLTPLISVSEDMLAHDYSSEDSREAVEVIHGQCRSIKQFLDSYHELTHLPKPTIAPIQVQSLLLHIRHLYPDLHISIQCAQGMILQGDEGMIRQILVNLVKNAREAGATAVEFTASSPNGIPRITVGDNGSGIPKELQEDIFLPFYTSKQTGSGIGLALSRQIMNLHQGSLTCSTHETGGALFILDFPSMRTPDPISPRKYVPL